MGNVVLSQPLALLSSIVAARVLGIDGFGQFSFIRSTVLMLGVFAGTGLGIAATRHVAEFRHVDPARAGRIVSLLITVGAICGSLVFLLTYLLAPEISHLIHNDSLPVLLTLASPLLLLNILNGIYTGVLVGLEKYKLIAVLGVLEGVCTLMFVTVGAWISQAPGAVLGMVASALVLAIARHIITRQESATMGILLNTRNILLEVRLLRRVALPAVLIAASIQPFEWFGRVLISSGGDRVGEVGIFSAVQSWAQFMTVLPAQVTLPSMAILASLYAAGDYGKFRKLILTSLKVVGILSIAVALPLFIFSEWIMALYGPEFLNGVPALRVMLLAYSVAVATMVFTEALISADRVWLQTLQKLLWGVTMIFAAYFLSPMGAVGLAISYALANFLFLVVQAVAVRRVFSSLPLSCSCGTRM